MEVGRAASNVRLEHRLMSEALAANWQSHVSSAVSCWSVRSLKSSKQLLTLG